jgi:hypothetical protein
VTQFLAALESGLPLIAVRELSVTHGEPNLAPGRAESLHLDFVVEGLGRFDSIERRR